MRPIFAGPGSSTSNWKATYDPLTLKNKIDIYPPISTSLPNSPLVPTSTPTVTPQYASPDIPEVTPQYASPDIPEISQTLPPIIRVCQPLQETIDLWLIQSNDQLLNIQQSKAAIGEAPEVIPLNIDSRHSIFEEKALCTIKQCTRPTNEIDEEIENLKILFSSGFIFHSAYEKRLAQLMDEKKHSFVTIIPHVTLNFAQVRRTATVQSKSRNVRIFVSSTFKDMQQEREGIVKHIIPNLQQYFKSRGVFVSAVDLRWGITSEETSEGNTINICLNEIDRCRPYFLCLLGHRYGWSQPADNKSRDALLSKTFEIASRSKFSWIKKYDNRSVTELEIRHAVLNHLGHSDFDTTKSLFYLKGKDKLQSSEGDDDPRLTSLKEDIISNIKNVNYYTDTTMELVEKISEDLKRILLEDFPLHETPTFLQQEKMAHTAFQETRLQVYSGREYYFTTINAHLANDNPSPIVITGSGGSGKSALLCNWVAYYQETHHSSFVIAHYVGCTSSSSNLGRMLLRIINEIRHYYKLNNPIPQEVDKLIETLPEWFSEASRRGGLVLVLDALDKLENRNNAFELTWLPPKLPSNIHIIISSGPCRVLDVAINRRWKILQVEPLMESERKTLVQEYITSFGKTFTEEQSNIITSSHQCENPLFLKTFLEEIRMFGEFENLSAKINYYFKAKTPAELFELVLERVENDLTTNRSTLQDALSLLCVSRSGLTEPELTQILNLTPLIWSQINFALNDYIVNRSGYLTFFSQDFRKAVESRYVRSTHVKYRNMLIDYFTNKSEDKQRIIEELPSYYELNQNWNLMNQFITNLENFLLLNSEQHKFDLYRYWRALRDAGLKPATFLLQNLLSENDYATASTFLREIGEYKEAEICAEKALNLSKKNSPDNHELIAERLELLAKIIRQNGDFAPSAEYYNSSLKLRENLSDKQKLAKNLNSLASVNRQQGKFKIAEPLFERALNIRLSLYGGTNHPDIANSYTSISKLYQDMGQYPNGEKYFLQALQIYEVLYGNNHLNVAKCMENLGGLYVDWCKYKKAKPIFNRALKIYETIFGPSHPHVSSCLNSIGTLYQELGKFNKAEKIFLRALTINENFLGPFNPRLSATTNELAALYTRMKEFQKALNLYKRTLTIREKSLGKDHPSYAVTLTNMAGLYRAKGEYGEETSLLNSALEINTKIFGQKHQAIATILTSLAGVNQLTGKYNEALSLYEKAIQILLSTLGTEHSVVARTLNDMAVLYSKVSQLDKAEDHFLRALKTYQTVFGINHHQVGIATQNLAQFYKQKDIEKSRKYYKQALEIFTTIYGENDKKTLELKEEIKSV